MDTVAVSLELGKIYVLIPTVNEGEGKIDVVSRTELVATVGRSVGLGLGLREVLSLACTVEAKDNAILALTCNVRVTSAGVCVPITRLDTALEIWGDGWITSEDRVVANDGVGDNSIFGVEVKIAEIVDNIGPLVVENCSVKSRRLTEFSGSNSEPLPLPENISPDMPAI